MQVLDVVVIDSPAEEVIQTYRSGLTSYIV
jgi:hypothetical protein